MCNLLRNVKVRNLEKNLLFIIIKCKYLVQYHRAPHITLILSYNILVYIILIISPKIGGFYIFRYQLMLYNNIYYITLGPSFEYECSNMYAYVLVLCDTIMLALVSYYFICICIFIASGNIYNCCSKGLNCNYVAALKKCSGYKCRSIAYNNNNEYINERIFVAYRSLIIPFMLFIFYTCINFVLRSNETVNMILNGLYINVYTYPTHETHIVPWGNMCSSTILLSISIFAIILLLSFLQLFNGIILTHIDNNVLLVIKYYYSLMQIYVEIPCIQMYVNNSCTLHDIMHIPVLYRNIIYLTDLGIEHRYTIYLFTYDNCIVVVGSLGVYLQILQNGLPFLMMKYFNGPRGNVPQVKSRLITYCTCKNYNIDLHLYMYILYINALYFRPYNSIINLNNAVKYEAKLMMHWIFNIYISLYIFNVTECEHRYRSLPVLRKKIIQMHVYRILYMCNHVLFYYYIIISSYNGILIYLYASSPTPCYVAPLFIHVLIRLCYIHVYVPVVIDIELRYNSGGTLNSQFYSIHPWLMRTYIKYG